MAVAGSWSADAGGRMGPNCDDHEKTSAKPGEKTALSDKRNKPGNTSPPNRNQVEHAQFESALTSQGTTRTRLASILIRKKTSFGLSKTGRTQSDLQAVEKARLAQSMGLEP